MKKTKTKIKIEHETEPTYSVIKTDMKTIHSTCSACQKPVPIQVIPNLPTGMKWSVLMPTMCDHCRHMFSFKESMEMQDMGMKAAGLK